METQPVSDESDRCIRSGSVIGEFFPLPPPIVLPNPPRESVPFENCRWQNIAEISLSFAFTEFYIIGLVPLYSQ